MIYTDDTIIAGLAEVRNNLPSLVVELKGGKVIITKRGQPVAVLQSYQKYKNLEALAEEQENQELLAIALEREKDAQWISQEEMEERIRDRLNKE